ncbi:MAG: hypothetical protein MHM6MM_000199 [Cercozoa sp. M6MM]
MNLGLDADRPVWNALLGGLVTWFATALGAGAVLLSADVSQNSLDMSMGAAGGVMVAASCFGLLQPSVEYAAEIYEAEAHVAALPAVIGVIAAFVSLRLASDALERRLSASAKKNEEEIDARMLRDADSWRRVLLLVGAVTVHNLPEGIAVGVAFAAAQLQPHKMPLALSLTLAIALQNVPEGMAVSVPLRKEGVSTATSFLLGQLSGLVEPIGAVLGAYFTTSARAVLPFALAYAAGAMLFVVAAELLAESGRRWSTQLGFAIGFSLMMYLDVALG